jgi:hypothetical protein
MFVALEENETTKKSCPVSALKNEVIVEAYILYQKWPKESFREMKEHIIASRGGASA